MKSGQLRTKPTSIDRSKKDLLNYRKFQPSIAHNIKNPLKGTDKISITFNIFEDNQKHPSFKELDLPSLLVSQQNTGLPSMSRPKIKSVAKMLKTDEKQKNKNFSTNISTQTRQRRIKTVQSLTSIQLQGVHKQNRSDIIYKQIESLLNKYYQKWMSAQKRLKSLQYENKNLRQKIKEQNMQYSHVLLSPHNEKYY